jgi:hypothetical protein
MALAWELAFGLVSGFVFVFLFELGLGMDDTRLAFRKGVHG